VTATRDDLDDAALLRAHADGDADAFGELVRRHRDRLWAVAVRTLGDREEAADAVQDALLSAYRAADRFRGDSAVTTWLHRIVVNACLDRLRRRQARPTVPLPDFETASTAAGMGVGRPVAAPAHDSDTALTVQAALAKLPADQRVALVLLDVQGYSVAEIASMLGVAEGTVKSRCARGRAKLAVMLGHLRPAPPGDPDLPTGVPGNRPAPDGVGSAASSSEKEQTSGTDHVGQGGVR
jgi:RNA polymerase sigma-70 factor (ECF subfamily)